MSDHPLQLILDVMADASAREHAAFNAGGWLQPMPEYQNQVDALIRDGLVEADGRGYLRPTDEGMKQSNPVQRMQ